MSEREWEQLERKSSFGRKVVETVAAFCNTSGGIIEIGVDDDGTPAGTLTIGDSTLEGWANQIKQETDPGQTPSIREEVRDGQPIVRIRVSESPLKPVLAYGQALKRVGRTNQRMGYGEVKRLVEESTGDSWDARQCPDASPEDISNDAVVEFVSRAQQERGRPMQGAPREVLRKMRLLRDSVPTYAAVLLFGDDPQKYLPQSVVKCARFKGTSSVEFIDERTLYGNVFDQIDSAHEFALRHMSKGIQVNDQPQREEQWEYPPEAVRELIINAVCHRDYQIAGNVQLRMFDDRLEVWTPGGLPFGVTPDLLEREHRSVPRNRRIAECLFLTGYIEQWGSGTLRVIDLCSQRDLPQPEFEEDGNTFIVRLRSERHVSEQDLIDAGMNDRQMKAMEYVRKHGEISNSEYREINDVSRATATNELAEIVEAGLLTATGEGRARKYVIP